MIFSPVHLNGDLLCAMDVGTTGSNIEINEITHVVAIPLKPDYTVSCDFPIFEMKIKPSAEYIDHPETKMFRNRYTDYMKSGYDPFMAADQFNAWFDSLKLAFRKRIVPVAHNFAGLDKPFLQKWLGPLNYDHRISCNFRDTMIATLFIDDICDVRAEKIPFPKTGLSSICRRLGILRNKVDGPIGDARCHAEVYHRLLRYLR